MSHSKGKFIQMRSVGGNKFGVGATIHVRFDHPRGTGGGGGACAATSMGTCSTCVPVTKPNPGGCGAAMREKKS
ncbi:hypothetical protein NYE24_11445 [Paenibacillus sp. FSL H7-0350]|uniref:hypothetical protein n=1 Tax=Paenibacillus sp. FSL H7-0350 TaxID=2975345 RepID=UPI00315835E9